MNNIQLNIRVTFSELVEAVKQLSPKEKLIINQVIWDAENMEIPLEQQELVLHRKQDSEENGDNMLDWDQAVQTLTVCL